MSGHTPGPWVVHTSVTRGRDGAVIDRGFGIFAGEPTWHDNKGHTHPDDAKFAVYPHAILDLWVPDYDCETPVVGSEADARLIAAAPDLLAALESFMGCLPADMSKWRMLGMDTTALTMARLKGMAALQKAGAL